MTAITDLLSSTKTKVVLGSYTHSQDQHVDPWSGYGRSCTTARRGLYGCRLDHFNLWKKLCRLLACDVGHDDFPKRLDEMRGRWRANIISNLAAVLGSRSFLERTKPRYFSSV